MGYREIREWQKCCKRYDAIYKEYNKRLRQNRKNPQGLNKVEKTFDSILESKERKINKAWELQEKTIQTNAQKLKSLWANCAKGIKC